MSLQFILYGLVVMAIFLILTALTIGILSIPVKKRFDRYMGRRREEQAEYWVRNRLLRNLEYDVETKDNKKTDVMAVLWVNLESGFNIRLASPENTTIYSLIVNYEEKTFEWWIDGKKFKTLPLADLHDLVKTIMRHAWVDSTIHSKDPYGHLLKTTGQAA